MAKAARKKKRVSARLAKATTSSKVALLNIRAKGGELAVRFSRLDNEIESALASSKILRRLQAVDVVSPGAAPSTPSEAREKFQSIEKDIRRAMVMGASAYR